MNKFKGYIIYIIVYNTLILSLMENTGFFMYTTLVEVDSITGVPTGRTKPNIPGDIDYIPPQQNLQSCPILTTTTTTIKFDRDFDSNHDNDHN